MKRRDFIRGAAYLAVGTAAVACGLKRGGTIKDTSETIPAQEQDRSPRPYQPIESARFKLSWEPFELSLIHSFTVSGSSRTTTPDVLVRLEYDGYTGYGEASLPPYLGHTVDSVCKFLSKVDLSPFRDPFRLTEIMDYVNSLSDGDAPAKAAVDIALHDLFGKLMGQPLWRIKGLDPTATPNTSFTIGMDTPENMAAKTKEVEGKYKILKVKLGAGNDLAMIDAIRSVSSLPIAVDVNQGWKDRMKALYEMYALKERGVVLVEQPLPKNNFKDLAWLSERAPLPIFADEAVQNLADLKRISHLYNGVNIKLMKCGGLLEAEKMKAYAKACGMKVMLGCMTETSCAISAAAQISPGVDFADLDGNLLISNDPFEGVKIIDGKITLNNLPGLGLTVAG
ncbi:MAG TPA: dipeptide epimerase [Candidatus Cryptobacteroides sp.]|nr:dipeptide epimerase [Candidatus Cryptobacteroides sp.]